LTVYLNFGGGGPNFLEIRSFPGQQVRIADCRAAIAGVNPDLRIDSLAPLSAAIDRTLAPERLVSWVSAGFGIVALLLTSVGLYGILAYGVARRTSEFGIRMALGAEPASIRGMVLREGLALTGIGLGAGLIAALCLVRLVTRLLFGIRPFDPATFIASALVLLAIAAAAAYGPARRATSADPVAALRSE